ncbi:SAM-dependent DNA methyltransferase [Xenorhabdus sp. PB61.4]|uniref:hypothetical protein n=1 Tax=Xenorhabdus sp. PB61.4 TaxID=2788940 RepID=UPI001E3B61B7|nr:hypothetical protein [Xenorhabdus sp. PB61.4]MCC8367194.1 SAM-dependent DNA methyltransferase [Xenorhabdus sp. PB61.4]
MRSKIEANDYKNYILGFIFHNFFSDKQIQFLIQNEFDEQSLKDLNEGDSDTLKYIQNELGHFIDYDNLFLTWISNGKDFDIAYVRDALPAFTLHQQCMNLLVEMQY